MSSPSTPSPAARHFARFCQRSGRGTGGQLVRFWAMQSPPHRHTSPPIYQQPAAGIASTVFHPARLVLVLVLFLQVVMVWQRDNQGGRFPQAHPVDPLHPAGVRPNICGHLQRGAEIRQTYQGGGRCRTRLKVLGKNYKVVLL